MNSLLTAHPVERPPAHIKDGKLDLYQPVQIVAKYIKPKKQKNNKKPAF